LLRGPDRDYEAGRVDYKRQGKRKSRLLLVCDKRGEKVKRFVIPEVTGSEKRGLFPPG